MLNATVRCNRIPERTHTFRRDRTTVDWHSFRLVRSTFKTTLDRLFVRLYYQRLHAVRLRGSSSRPVPDAAAHYTAYLVTYVPA